MQRWRLDLAWDGGAYMGWQRQPHGPTIQGAVEDALAVVLAGERVTVGASGRTDAGVHARHQVASFTAETPRTVKAMADGLNGVLPRDVACLSAEKVSEDFDPRRWARGKTYRYRILRRRARCPFRGGQAWHIKQRLDVEAMAAAAPALVGWHDFSAFRARGCTAKNPRRWLQSLSVDAVEDEVHIEAFGHGFLRHQVRIMAGTLVEVGRQRMAPEGVAEVLASRDRTRAGRTAPPRGLWLMKVVLGDGPRTPRVAE